MASYQLTFPRSLTQDNLVSFLGSLHGLARSRSLMAERPSVTLETEATGGRIRHRLVVDDRYAELVEAALRSTMPSVRLEDDRYEEEQQEFTVGIELTASNRFRALRMDDLTASASTILASMQPLGPAEVLRLQWILAPAPAPAPPRLASRGRKQPLMSGANDLPDSELVRAYRQKQSEPLFLTVARVAVSGADDRRAKHIIGRVFSAIRRAEAPGIRLRVRVMPSLKGAARRTQERTVSMLSWGQGLTLNSAELAGVLGVPLEGPNLPGLIVGASRQLPLTPSASRSGVEVAQSTYPGDQRSIRMPVDMRRQHTLLLGPTGSGKSNLMVSMVLQDAGQDRGVIVLDPKADFVEDILARIPEHRADDVIVLDATDREMPVGLNPIALARNTEAQRELVVDNVVGTVQNLFSATWGVRSGDVFRSMLMTLVATTADDGSAWTLADVPAVLDNGPLRRHLAAQVEDPAVQSFWTYYENLSDAQQAEVAAPLQNKLRSILLKPSLRRILGQSKGIDLFDIIQQRKILIVPLPKGQLGEDSARLLGALVVAELWAAVMARTVIPKDQRSVFMAYLDEAHNFIHLPVAVGDMLAEARGLGLGLLMATQSLSQFPKDLQDGVLTNARTKLLYKQSHDDARKMSRYVEPRLGIEDLKGLPDYELIVHSDATGNSMTATGVAQLIGPAIRRPESIRQLSRARLGVPREDVDTALVQRQMLVGMSGSEVPSATPKATRPIGARRRVRREDAA